MAGTLSFVVYMSVKRFIFSADDPFMAAKRYVPIYMFLMGYVVGMVTLLKGLKHVGLDLSIEESMFYAVGVAAVITVIGVVVLSRVKRVIRSEQHDLISVEKVFGVLMLFTACAMAPLTSNRTNLRSDNDCIDDDSDNNVSSNAIGESAPSGTTPSVADAGDSTEEGRTTDRSSTT